MRIRHGYHPKYQVLCETFCNGCDLDQLREGLLLKESYKTIYNLMGTVKLPRKNNFQKFSLSFKLLP